MNEQPLVHIVDDEEDMRTSLRMLLESVGIEATCHPSVDSFLAGYDPGRSPDRPTCLLLDVRMPGVSGMTLLEQLHAQHARLPVIMLTGYGDIPMSVSAMKLGAADFVTKPVNHQQLLDRIQEVLRNHALQRGLPGADIDPQVARERLDSLTPREREIFTRIANGDSNKLIAYDLGISVRTVESHRANIMEKLEARSVVDLVQLALSL
jgi:two-component system, LuxR family, response regulator FixJ